MSSSYRPKLVFWDVGIKRIQVVYFDYFGTERCIYYNKLLKDVLTFVERDLKQVGGTWKHYLTPDNLFEVKDMLEAHFQTKVPYMPQDWILKNER